MAKLDTRLKKVENAASKTSDRVDPLGDDIDDLQSRVEELEQAAETNTDTTETDYGGDALNDEGRPVGRPSRIAAGHKVGFEYFSQRDHSRPSHADGASGWTPLNTSSAAGPAGGLPPTGPAPI